MNNRRFDRNADQLAQIMNHYRQLRQTMIAMNDNVDIMLENAIVMLDAILEINDKIAESAQKETL